MFFNAQSIMAVSSRARERDRVTQTDRDRDGERQRQRENSNLKALFYKDCSLGSVKNLTTSPC